ncbi:uncharacterized protein Dana_GF22554, isoform F [Drosophila ananassae]|uniref:Uncharacterized protein, isoform C n=1 Tax=Drosophila ananassae TaxID=7217 RepID=A0A0P8ZKT6_DROAN|nr:uncharacterized protein Dana_GF22554, isoform C [Drosophila ananassae]KPU75418.1 uncharacterized protein Dana_GF22554, isoform F [Drosophila ananassae]
MQAPPTPKTELLEQRNKELLGLRALLETERYEKNVLEEQIMENEHLINSLAKENKVKKIQLAKLKADRNDEEDGDMRNYVPNEFDHLKRSLMKEITQKEALIAETSDKLQDLRTEKAEVDNKLKMASEQVVVCMDRIRELELRAEEANQLLAAKNSTISAMERDKEELEQCLQEAREELHNRREVLNASSDLLNCSLSPNTTPENLASSVIDKQLRERELENTELRDEIQKMQKTLQKLTEDVEDTLKQFSLKEVQPGGSFASRVRSAFGIMETGYEEELAKVKDMKEQMEAQSQMQEKLFESNKAMTLLIEEQKSEIGKLKGQNSDLERSSAEMIQKYEKELQAVKEHCERELQEQKHCHEAIQRHDKELREKLAEADDHLEKMKQQLVEKEEQFAQLGRNLKVICEKNKDLECRAARLHNQQELVRAKYLQCQQQLVAKTTDISQLADNLDTADWDSTLARIDEVIEARNRLIAENSALQSELLQNRERIQTAEQRLSQFEEVERSLQAENTAVKEQHAVLNEMHTTMNMEHVALNVEHAAVSKELAALKEELQEANERYATMRQRNHDFINQVNEDLTRRELALKQEFRDQEDEMAKRLRRAFQRADDFLHRITDLVTIDLPPRTDRSTLDSLAAEEEVWSSELTQAENLLTAEICERSKQLADLRTETDQLARDQEKRMELIGSLNNCIKELRSSLEQKQREVAEAQAQLATAVLTDEDSLAALKSRLDLDSSDDVIGNCLIHIQQMDDSRQFLEADNERLTRARHKLEEEVQQLHDQIAADQTAHIMKRLNGSIQNLEQVNEKLSTDYAKLQLLHSDMEHSLTQAELKVESMTTHLTNTRDKIAKLEEGNGLKALRITELEKQLKDLVIEVKIREAKAVKMEDLYVMKMKSVKDDLQEQVREKVTALEEHHKMKMKSAELEKEVQIKELEVQLSEQQEKLSEKQQKLSEQQEKLSEQEEKLSEKVQKLSEQETKLSEQEQKLSEQEQKLSQQEKKISEQEEQLIRKEEKHLEEIKNMKADCSGSIHQLEKEHWKQVQGLQEELAETNREMCKQLSDHAQEMRQLQQKAVDIHRLEELKTANAEMVAERKDMEVQLKQLEEEMKREKQLAQQEIDQLKARLRESEEQMDALVLDLEQSKRLAKEESERLAQEIQKQAAELKEATKQAKLAQEELVMTKLVLQEQGASRKEEVDGLLAELVELREKAQEEEDSKDAEKLEIEALKEALSLSKDQAKEEIAKFKEQQAQAHSHAADAKNREHHLAQREIGKLTKQLSQAHSRLEEAKSQEQEKIAALQQELAETQEATKEKIEEVRKQATMSEEHQKALQEIEVLREKLSHALADMEKQVKALTEARKNEEQTFQEEKERLKEELAKAEELVRKAENCTQQERQQAQEEILTLKEQLCAALKENGNEKAKGLEEIERLTGQLREAQQSVQEQMRLLAETKSQTEQLAKAASENFEEQLRLESRKLEEERLNSNQLSADLRKQEQELRRLRGQLTTQTTRVEKDSVALEESQAEAKRLQEELGQAKAVQEEQSAMIEMLKRDKEAVLREIHLVKERTQGADREHQVAVATLEDQLETLEKLRVQAEIERSAAHERITKLEAMRESQEREVRDLNAQLADAEQEKVRLNLEIGGLNSEIGQCRQTLAKQADDIVVLQQSIETVQLERQREREQLAQLQERLNEVQQELDGNRLVHDALHFELEEKTRELEQEQGECTERVQRYVCRVEELERELADSQNQVQMLQNRNPSPTADLGATYSKSDAPPADADAQAQGDLLRQSEARNNKLELDCQILQAKYREAKEEIQRCEQKIKDQRLEMEGKLDKMKNKMRSLYTAEVTRMKEKQERDAAGNKAELEALTAQNAKYEEHTRKLSNQIVRLNEKILEQQKQHAITSTKLRHLQMQPVGEPLKPTPPTASIGSTAASSDDWQPFKRPSAPSSNLAMEDEEGEVFNNTYLTDLKLGRVPDVITAEELNYRNSLQPPHLKSAYAAQYDLGSHDEEFKDGPHSLDDSMSALLSSSTSHGTRKKSMGTHYKRPGPPTPSKHGGRLSFGSSEPPREILRECGDHNNGSSKTPARFKFLSSRFSVGSSGLPRDEHPIQQLPRRKRPNLLTGMQRRRLQRQVDSVFCTSTPRKSRSYYDQQRLIRVSDAATPDAGEDESEAEQLDTVDVPEPESEAELPNAGNDDQGTPHLSNGALFAITKGHTRRITGHVAAQRRKGRVSLCLHGNIFAKSRPAGGTKISASSMAGKMMQQRRKLRQDRVGRFDQGRHLEDVRLSGNLTYSVVKTQDNNNYSLHNRNEEQSPQVVEKSPPPVATTFLVDTAARAEKQEDEGQDRSATWQLRQQFEMENLANWQSFSEDNSPGLFEQLCKDTASTAPFQLHPLVYQDQALEMPVLPRSSSSVTEASCSTTQTNVTSGASVASAASTLSAVSSRKSCTVFSLSSFHVQPLPHVNVTYVQRTNSRMQPVRDHSLRDQCWRFLGQLGPGKRLVVIVALLSIVVLCSQWADRMVLTISALLAGMVLLMVIMPGRH